MRRVAIFQHKYNNNLCKPKRWFRPNKSTNDDDDDDENEWKGRSIQMKERSSCFVIDGNYLILLLIRFVCIFFFFHSKQKRNRNLMDICFYGRHFYTSYCMVNFLFYSLEFVTKVISVFFFLLTHSTSSIKTCGETTQIFQQIVSDASLQGEKSLVD